MSNPEDLTVVWGAVIYGDIPVHEARLAYWLLSLGEVVAWYEQMMLEGVTFKRQGDGWNMIVKASSHNAGSATSHWVAFYWGHDLADCVQTFANAVSKQNILWSRDKYA